MTSLCLVIESGTDVRLVEGLAERFELTVIARRIEGGVEVSHAPSKPLELVVGPASRAGFARFVWKYLRARRREFDHVVVQGYGPAALTANVAGRVTRTPTAMLLCSPVEAYYRCRRDHPEPGKPFRRRELWGLQMLARLNALIGQKYFVLSEHLADVVRGHGARRPVEVIPVYGVDTELFAPPGETKDSIKAGMNLPTTGALVFFSSRIAPEKDSETLLAAVRLLLDRGREVWLLHRSGGHLAFVRDAERFGLAGRVVATDAVHPHGQLPRDYQACDLCVQASREEGLGFSPLEALACETPVVAAAVGGLRETIVDGQTGWSYPAGDAHALAKCIEEILDDPAEAARRAAAGRRLVRARFDTRAVFGMFESALSVEDGRETARVAPEAV